MPGTPSPVLGSPAATVAVAATAGLVIAASAVVVVRGRTAARTAAVVAAPYVAVTLSLWAAVRQRSGFSFAGYESDAALAGWLAGAALVLAVQAGAAGYAFAR